MMNTTVKRKIRQSIITTSIILMLIILIIVSTWIGAKDSCPTLSNVGQILSAVFVVALAWVLIAFFYSKLKRIYVILTGFFLVFLWGVIVYQGNLQNTNYEDMKEVGLIAKIVAPINNSLSVFFPSRGAYAEGNNSERTVSYQLFHLTSYFFFALLAFSLFGRKILNRSGHGLIRYRNKNVIWGYSENGVVLAKDIIASTCDDQVVFVLSEDITYNSETDNLIFDSINDLKAVAIYANYDTIKGNELKYSGVRHFFLTEDQDFNVRMALVVVDGLLKKKTIKTKTHIYIRTELAGIDLFFMEKIKNQKMIEVHLYNHSDLTARLFVDDNPIISHQSLTVDTTNCEVRGRFNLLLLGFGWTGFELLKKIVCDAQFLGSDYSFSVTIIDKDYETDHGRYKYLIDEACKEYNIEINPWFVDKKDNLKKSVSVSNGELFYDWLDDNNKITNFDRIIVALGNDELNVNTALQINRFRMQHQTNEKQFEKIFAHVRNFDEYKYYQSSQSPIKAFGDLNRTNSYNVIVNESLDNIGKLVNYVYSRNKVPMFSDETFKDIVEKTNEIELEWTKTTTFNKNSSREVGVNIRNLVILSGGVQQLSSRLSDPKYLEKYAELEHLRWNAFHFMNGVKKWDFSEVTTPNGKLSFNGVLLKHICLIPYDNLDEASRIINSTRTTDEVKENYKESDRRIIRHISHFLKYKDQPLKS